MAYVAIVITGSAYVPVGKVLKMLPKDYSILDSYVEANCNSVKVAHVQLRGDGGVVFYPTPFDNTGTVSKFKKAFEEKNPDSKFVEQSDA